MAQGRVCTKCFQPVLYCVCNGQVYYSGGGIIGTLSASQLPTKSSTEPLVGLRVWNLDRKTGTLRSTYQSQFTWPFRKPLCKDGIKDAGIHAVKKGERIVSRDSAPSVWNPAGISFGGLWQEYKADVAGKIYMWGAVTEHTEGYTAEFAYPKELWMPEETDPLIIMQLEHNYGVPVLLRDDLPPHPPKEATIDIDNVKAMMNRLTGLYSLPQIQVTIPKDFFKLP